MSAVATTLGNMGVPHNLSSAFKISLDAFLSSSAKFRTLETVSCQLPYINAPSSPPAPSDSYHSSRTLLILDSSFNPPTRAHLSMVTSVLRESLADSDPSSEGAGSTSVSKQWRHRFGPPYRILLLFSVHNADKSPSPAAFPQRLALMYMSALDILSSLSGLPAQSHQSSISADVAVTREPYYSDKSEAIDASEAYSPQQRSQPQHVHLIGYDTFVRFLDPKYYPSFHPRLSALGPFFHRHGLRLTLRASSTNEAQEQRQTWENLAQGGLESEGGQRDWASRIEVVDGDPESVGVSSTAVRKACDTNDWKTVDRLCTPRVAQWVKDHGLYRDDVAGKI